MKGQATVTTKTTINPVTITDVREATVVSTTATSMLVRGSDGMQRRFTQADLDKRGVEMIKDGKVVRISQLAPGDQLSAQIITREPPTFERAVDVKLAEAKMEPAPAKSAPAAAPAATPAATPAAPAATPAAAPTTVASTTPAPAAPSAAQASTTAGDEILAPLDRNFHRACSRRISRHAQKELIFRRLRTRNIGHRQKLTMGQRLSHDPGKAR